MTEPTRSSEQEEQTIDEGYDARAEIAPTGRYLPYSGGSMGWFENSGVLKAELPNNYLFYTQMDEDYVRAKQFRRWGERFNRRGDRVRVRKETAVNLRWDKQQRSGSTRDISRHGMRVQFLENLDLEAGAPVSVDLHRSEGGPVLMTIEARVVWSERIGRLRPVQNIGLSFAGLSDEQADTLRRFLE